MRLAEMPKVESIIMPAGGTVWGGVGEPTICVAAPAVLNAFFKATGKRIPSFPLKNHDIFMAGREARRRPQWRPPSSERAFVHVCDAFDRRRELAGIDLYRD